MNFLGKPQSFVRIWWNWQTRYFEVVVPKGIEVQVLLCAPLFFDRQQRWISLILLVFFTFSLSFFPARTTYSSSAKVPEKRPRTVKKNLRVRLAVRSENCGNQMIPLRRIDGGWRAWLDGSLHRTRVFRFARLEQRHRILHTPTITQQWQLTKMVNRNGKPSRLL